MKKTLFSIASILLLPSAYAVWDLPLVEYVAFGDAAVGACQSIEPMYAKKMAKYLAHPSMKSFREHQTQSRKDPTYPRLLEKMQLQFESQTVEEKRNACDSKNIAID